MSRSLALIPCIGVAVSATVAGAQEAQEPQEASPHEIVVLGSVTPSPLAELPWSITVVDPSTVAVGRPELSLAELTAAIPGLAVQSRANYAQDLRLSIRGFGARSSFGVRGIHVIVDGIPLTGPDGQTQLDSIDPQSVRRIEVLRSPSSMLFGNAAGGVLHLETADGTGGTLVDGATTLASFRTWRTSVLGQVDEEDWRGYVQASRVITDGHRAHMEAEDVAARASFTRRLPADLDLRAMLNVLHSPVAEDPGALTAQERAADPERAAPASLLFDAGESVDQLQLGLTLSGDVAGGHDLDLAVWGVSRMFDGRIPQRTIELDRRAGGLSGSWTWTSSPAGMKSGLSTGLQLQAQRDRRTNSTSDGGQPVEPRLLDQDEEVLAVGAWVQEQLAITSGLTAVAGLRVSTVRFEVDDGLGDDSGHRSFPALTGMSGVVVAPRESWQLYGNVAQSFETPTSTELVNRPDGGGGLNPELDATRALSIELGGRAAAGPRLAADVALFRIGLEDELVPFEDPAGRTVYRNAGRSHRVGGELSVLARPLPSLRLTATVSALRARFDELDVDGMDLSGNAVPGIRPWRGGAELAWSAPADVVLGITAELASGAWVEDTNSSRSGGFARVGARVGWRRSFASLDADLHVGADNLLDQSFEDNVRVNAFGGRYYEPAPPFTIWSGLELAWRFAPPPASR